MKLFTFIFGMVILCSCTNETNRKDIYSVKGSNHFYTINTKTINPSSRCIRYFNNDKGKWLFYENTNFNELIIYNLPQGDILKRTKFEKKGPNGIGSLKGFHVHNFDSIFLVSGTYIHQFYLTDTSGIVKKNYKLKPIDDKEIPFCVKQLWSNDCINESNIKNNTINLSTYYPFVGMETTKKINKKLPNEVIDFSYDLGENKIVNTSNYPNFKIETNNKLIFHNRCLLDEDRYIYSFRYLDNIYIQNNDSNYTIILCKSKYRTNPIEKGDSYAPIIQQMAHSVKNPHYLNIIHDKYRDCTYRYFYPGVELKDNEDPQKMMRNRKRFSIMILDENLDIVGETMMPDNTYNPFMSFVAEDGLYIALHCDHPKYNPDSLMFERIDLKPVNHE